MKYLILIVIALFITTGTYATNEIEVYFCDHKTDHEISRELLNSCQELNLNTKDWIIKSFSIGFEANGDFHSIMNSENKLKSKTLDSFKKYAPTKVYLEKVIVVNNIGEEKTLETITLKITD